MLFTGYIDESDTHGKEPDMVMSAFLGNCRQWELFNRGLRRTQKEFGFTIFHTVDFKHGDGEFAGWGETKCMALINRLTELVRDKLTEGIVTHLPYALYQDEFIAKIPHKMPRTSQYGICFLATLERCLHIPIKQKGVHRLSLVVEKGHKNSGNVKDIFDERQERYRSHIGTDALLTIKFANKQESPELMVSDFLAHTIALGYRRKTVGLPNYTEMTDAQPRSNESGLTFQEITPAYLQAMRDEFEKDSKRPVTPACSS